MAPDSSWMEKLRSALTPSPRSSPHVAVLAFDVAAVMSKLLRLWRCLSDPHRLRRRPLSLPATRKLVSDDPSLLLSLARAELLDSLRLAVASLEPLCLRCSDLSLRQFRARIDDFAASGRDPERWSIPQKEMDSVARKMERYVSATASLYRQMDELAEREQYLHRFLTCQKNGGKVSTAIATVQQKVFWQREEVRRLKDASLWRRTFDSVTSLLARAAFTILTRIDHVFPAPPFSHSTDVGFWEANTAALSPPPGTLGADALALRFANVIAVMDGMVRSPHAIGPDARDDLYGMLPATVRQRLRARLRGVGGCAATDADLAGEWRAALESILDWLLPAAHNTLRWQAEKGFEKRGGEKAAGVMLTETLHLASRERTEETVVEILVGLNYVWRFEVEMGARRAALAAGAAVLAQDGNMARTIDLPPLPPHLSIPDQVRIGSPPLDCH